MNNPVGSTAAAPGSPGSPGSASALHRLGRACHDRPWRVLGVWIVSLVLAGSAVGAVGAGFTTEFTLPDVESAEGFDVLDEEFGGRGAGIAGSIVFEADQGVRDPSVREPMSELFAELDAMDDVRVVSPYAGAEAAGPGPGGGEQGAGRAEQGLGTGQQGPGAVGLQQISQDGTIAFAEVELPRDASIEDAQEVRSEIERLLPDVEGLRIEIGGQIFADFEPPESELLGLAFAVVILIVAFGSVIAMGLPIGTAMFGIGVGVALTTLLSNLVEMPEFTSTIAVMIGLGVGIDYALFIVTRYREELKRGLGESEATGRAIDTAGRAVLFAGTTVVISLMGMLLIGLAFVSGFAAGAATVVFVTMVASVTLLPALLGFVGERVETSRWRGVVAAGLVALGLVGAGLSFAPLLVAFPAAAVVLVAGAFIGPLRAEVPRREPKALEESLPYRWSRLIQAKPWPALLVGAAALLALAVPLLGLRLGFSDEGNYPEDTTTRQAYDLLAEGFGPGFNGPVLVVAELGQRSDAAALPAIGEALAATEGVAQLSPPIPNDPQTPTAALWQVIPETAPQDAETEALVNRLRGDVLPEVTAGTGVDIVLTGGVAVNVDFSDYLGARTPLFMVAVLGLSFLLLMVVFRSLLVPLKAVVMNLISIGAAYGLAVMVFQWGWGAELIGVSATGPIEPFIPMMLFAIVFGLSMDYEVFLLSRIREEYDRGSANAVAVADGLAATARVITAAAAIMVFVFGSFLLESDRTIKLMGFGLAVAILLDATVVRMVLVPATMELLGDRNWWLPGPLQRLLPTIDVEGGGSGGEGPPQPGVEKPEHEPAGV